MRKSWRLTRSFFSICATLSMLVACDEGEFLLKSLEQEGDRFFSTEDSEPVRGEALESYVRAAYTDQSIGVSGILEVLNLANETAQDDSLLPLQGQQAPPSVSPEGLRVLNRTDPLKRDLDPNGFQKNANAFFIPETVGPASGDEGVLQLQQSEEFTWTLETDEFIISALDRMPVRNQGRRGTCAAFAGIGQIEALLINKFQLNGIDLSEQRFYFMSKPDAWNDGGSLDSQGSNSGTGFAKSAGYEYQGVTYPPETPSDFNIPLEKSCLYNDQPGDNDVQLPQAETCRRGVAKVSDFRAWLYRWNERPASAQQVFDFLTSRNYPVVVASGLSENWERNDGMITLADSDTEGETSHAVGHAYLVVGARKIDESLYPGEGGMCFIIRNSWGKGWGIDGHACMTLAWFNAWKYKTGFPQALDVELNTTKFEEARLDVGYDRNVLKKPASSNSGPNQGDGSKRRGEASFGLQEDDSLGEAIVRLDAEGRGQQFFYRLRPGVIEMNALLSSGDVLSQTLVLPIEGEAIYLEQAGYPTYQAGALNQTEGQLLLCSGSYTGVCDLRLDPETNELIIGLTPEQKSLRESTPPYNWVGFDLLGYGLEFSKPSGINTEIDARLKVNDSYTNPLRFLIDPLNSIVRYKGTDVGSFATGSLCSGEYQDACRLVLNEGDFHVFFRSLKDE